MNTPIAPERRHAVHDLQSELFDFPSPVEAIKFRMEQQGLTVEDLVPVIGRKNWVYEVLAGKRPLTLRMIENLHETFSIPAESLLKHSRKRDGQST